MMIGSSLTVRIHVTQLDRAGLEELFHSLGEALLSRQGKGSSLLDHAVAIDLAESTIEISVTAAGKTEGEAEALADYYILQALEATGGEFDGDELPTPSSWPAMPIVSSHFAGEITARELVTV